MQYLPLVTESFWMPEIVRDSC